MPTRDRESRRLTRAGDGDRRRGDIGAVLSGQERGVAGNRPDAVASTVTRASVHGAWIIDWRVLTRDRGGGGGGRALVAKGSGSQAGPEGGIRSLLFVEYGMGHRTHFRFLERHLDADPRFEATAVRLYWMDTLSGLVGKLRIPALNRRGLDFWTWWLFQFKRQQINGMIRRRQIDRSQLDLVYFHTQTGALAMLDLPRHVPAVVSIDLTWKLGFREARYVDSPFFEPVYALERRIFERSDLIVSFSEWAAASVVEDYGIPASKVKVVRNGVTLPGAASANQQRSLVGVAAGNGVGSASANGHGMINGHIPAASNGHAGHNGHQGNGAGNDDHLLRLGFVGNEWIRKGGDLLLRVHQERFADQAHLTLVCGDLPKRNGDPWHNVSAHLAVPWDELMTDVVPGFDLFVFPTRFDYSPYAVIEAMTAGVPVVATGVGAIPEMIEDGVSGFLLESAEEEPLIERVSWALEHRAQLPGMGDQARLRATTSYAAAQNYPELLDLLAAVARR